ncbi:MAG: 16S rRNA (adenine(1518)-N(6)/adenine(1519)-N(6))-dimethyltransferase RsmA [Prolixibacteraceae bacterium]|jgi:16S rRNA (adenine1518-N6/adenine1519-N6)-dimethyltransferase|nr:16S rRNA (adenine(1518)-N(6)/adenine(1519)-N(6))-dimethyltransferase RsmA [Prolixibacteraceae bacterium]MBT6764092.1 16S rRNA (adenine(1518)-N(6)/adenine(1519)-N(6))-dimethyltransferase RsmA [Prolixibacteraceae bacterium]MBT6997310.1 16S rRNA (adenine(1518)-N(6)/adenine(1519)-N(6))-dimethyltransferase RsmA [Prolixibacteraceae bacterium]MBT7395669.1 16S rRNA (adenine(1518)-N(6)/adenine(1519)-N(6))-dimethyltransferase RsmA [Prolixibacteraceae bacterium]
MNFVKPKKNLGQHFLTDQNIAHKIVDCLGADVSDVLEVGPGMGVLTRFLLERSELKIHVIEIDRESVQFLEQNFPELKDKIYFENFLKFDIAQHFSGNVNIIGNFPYNISSQILFKVLQYRDNVPEVVGMLQKEVAERISSAHGSKKYGILSVMLQVFYNIEYLFTVSEQVFDPPPKVKSAVIRLKRNNVTELPCNEAFFVKVVKAAFNQRRKMLRNSLKGLCENLPEKYAEKRPEQVSVDDFIELTKSIEDLKKNQDHAI